jgi:hypothetical protein
MKEECQLKDLVYNCNTKEDGTIRRIYETNGAAMYEVAVPQQRESWAGGYYISDWAGDVLQLSNNERLTNHSLRAHCKIQRMKTDKISVKFSQLCTPSRSHS